MEVNAAVTIPPCLNTTFIFPHREETGGSQMKSRNHHLPVLEYDKLYMTDYLHYATRFRGQAVISARGAHLTQDCSK